MEFYKGWGMKIKYKHGFNRKRDPFGLDDDKEYEVIFMTKTYDTLSEAYMIYSERYGYIHARVEDCIVTRI